MLKAFRDAILSYDPELNKIVQLVGPERGSVLEIGCGYGRVLRALQKQQINVLGVDLREDIVLANCSQGLPCKTEFEFESEYKASSKKFDVLILSHVIEHFLPADLNNFLNKNLRYVKDSGRLIIASPLPSPHFYSDFDHVRPYPPESLLFAYGQAKPQCKLKNEVQLKLESVWYRRHYFYCPHHAGHFGKSLRSYCVHGIELFSALLFRLSGGRFGFKDAWVGVFTKI